MPGSTLPRGNILVNVLVGAPFTPVAIAADTTAEQPFALPGVKANDFITVQFAGLQTAGVAVEGARCIANDVLVVAFSNSTVGSLVPAAGIYTAAILRPENFPLPTNAV